MSRVLVIDDEADIVESLQVMLRKRGFEALCAADGASGLLLAQREKPDLILCDVMMPAMNGFEVCRQLKASSETNAIPVLLLTALNQMDDKIKGLDAGADDFITKPFNDSELRARVTAFLRSKQLHDELDASYRRLQELEQMRDALTGMIVHDLKAPLTAITGGLGIFIDYLGKESLVPADIQKLVRNAFSSSKRLVGLIQDILDVSRMEQSQLPLKKSPTDLKAMVEQAVQMLSPAADNAKVALAMALPAGDVHATVDGSLIERVLVNLISNSLKFTPPGGKIAVSLTPAPDLRICVSDTGIGVPKEHLEKIFDKFFQSSGHEVSRKGQGLGLAFCRMAVESHGGKIWVESEQGKGSRFFVTLPA